ncbi:MAG: N-acetylglucosamine-6-phosphate deacetylase [Synergistaceae bacterium]|nr:N-acetylglucosamine-6-phosphate deacetylase [Synergistaceae bacterium]
MNNFAIKNALIFTPDCEFKAGTLHISNGIITNEPAQDPQVLESENLYIIPGLTDIHFHGCNGHDFCEGTIEALESITHYEAINGITSICPATMTLPEGDLTRIMRTARTFHESNPALAGINLEGPFISPSKPGAQNPDYIAKPDPDMLARLQDVSGGLIKIAVVAPEVDGGLEFVAQAKNTASISLGHTACDYEVARKAFALGANHLTHTYNAMNPIMHREPGPVIAALENKNVMIELICDGLHVHPAVIRSTMKLFGDDRVIFISDSTEATGMKDGNYMLGGQQIIKTGNKATLTDGKTLAGGAANLTDCVRIAVKHMNIPLESAIKCASVNPAKCINSSGGVIEAGRPANLAALDRDLNIKWVIQGGRLIDITK